MKKNMKTNLKNTTGWIMAFCLVSLMLAGCGSSSSYSAKEAGAPVPEYEDAYYGEEAAYAADMGDYYTDDVYEMEEAPEAGSAGSENAEILNESAQSSSRKLIKNVNLNVETEEFDKFMANIESKVTSLGGYVEMSEISGRSLYNTTSNRYASITARVPNDKLDAFVESVTSQSNITNKTMSTEDVTLQYADTQAHIDSLKTEQQRLNDLILKAEDLDTLLTLEARLTEVSYQIESYERQIRSLDNKVDYATIYIYVDEVTHYTPVEEEPLSAGQRISRGLSENLYQIGHGFQEFGIGFVIGLPYIILTLLIFGLIGLVIFLIVKAIVKAGKRNAEKNRMLQQQRIANAPAQRQTPVKPAQAKQQNTPAEEKPQNSEPDKK